MPFTFSHPAAVLPLTYLPKKWISMTGLMIGSLSPDFEYFFRMKVYSIYSHTWGGLLWFDLPMTLILAFIFHLIVRNNLIDNLPIFWFTRLEVYKNFNWKEYFTQNFIIVIISSIIGIATHILWDDFTHEQGQFVQSIAELKNTFTIAGFSIPTYKLLQHASTILGEVFVVYALLKLPKRKTILSLKSILPFWISVGFIALTIVAIRLLTGLDYKLYGNVITTLIAGGLIGLVVTTKLLPQKI